MPLPAEVKVRKIWDLEASRRAEPELPPDADLRGEIHPDLIRYKGWWYCGLKEAHKARLIRSQDGEQWESVHVFAWDSGLVGDLKFSETAAGALMITTFVKGLKLPSVGKPERLWTASVTWLSQDGVNWGHVHACPTGFAKQWVVRYATTWFRGAGYSVTSNDGDLFKTLDGRRWRLVRERIWSNWRPPEAAAELLHSIDHLDANQAGGDPPKPPTETALAFDPADGTACALVRTHPFFAMIGTASPSDYGDWTWRQAMLDWDGDGKLVPAHEKLGVQMGGPVLRYLSNGLLLAAGRYDGSPPDAPGSSGPLALFTLDRDRGVLRRWLDLAGHGIGRQYPGIVEHEGELWIVSGHVTKGAPFEVLLLKVPLPQINH